MDPDNPATSLPFDPFSVIVASPARDNPASFNLPPASTPALSTPSAPSHRPLRFSATPTPGLPGLSPSPSPPGHPGFNPDDFFASPPHPASSPADPARLTPELKRRLFGPSDPFRSTPSTAQKLDPTSSIGLTTPIRTTALLNPLSNNGSDDGNQDPPVSPVFSPGRALLGDVVAPHATSVRLRAPPAKSIFQNFSVKELVNPPVNVPRRAVPVLPGTPFTPAVTQNQRTKCSCKASKCLKLYCPCFASSGFCGPDCTCKNCQNSQLTASVVHDARETVLARDPRAFEPKVRNSQATASGDIHIKGCNCRKGCGKNYCVCRELRVDCGPRCTCSGPNGCLNGKSDALEDHQFKRKAERFLGPIKSRLPPSKAQVAQGSSSQFGILSGIRLKQERKRQKRDMLPSIRMHATPEEVANVLSPSFPSLSFSPVTGLKGSIGDFRRVLADGDDFSAVLSMQKGKSGQNKDAPEQLFDFGNHKLDGRSAETPGSASNAATATQETVLMVRDIPDTPQYLSSQLSAGGSEGAKADGKLSQPPLDVDDKENNKNNHNSGAPCELPRAPGLPKKRRPSPVKLEKEFDNVANESQFANNAKSRTPERRRLTSDMEAVTSPASDGKDASATTWSRVRGDLFGKEEKIEICRLPRILRVKMGSGRLLRKFEM